MGDFRRLLGGPGPPARGWRPEKGGTTSESVEAVAVAGENLGRSRGGLSTKIPPRCRRPGTSDADPAHPWPCRRQLQLVALLDGIRVEREGPGRPRCRPEAVILDKAYSHPSTREAMRPATPHPHGLPRTRRPDRAPGRERLTRRAAAFDAEGHKQRNVVERCFNRLKQFRDLATRYAKRTAYYHASLTIAAIIHWLRRLTGQVLVRLPGFKCSMVRSASAAHVLVPTQRTQRTAGGWWLSAVTFP